MCLILIGLLCGCVCVDMVWVCVVVVVVVVVVVDDYSKYCLARARRKRDLRTMALSRLISSLLLAFSSRVPIIEICKE